MSEQKQTPEILQQYRNLGHGGKIIVWAGGVILALILLGSLGGNPSGEATQQENTSSPNVAALREENAALQEENENLRAQLEELKASKTEEVTVNEGLSKAEEQDLRDRISYLEDRNSKLAGQVDDLENQLADAMVQADAQAAAPAPAPAGTKHVEVKVSCDIPCDVSIFDDNFDFSIAEQITGSKTFEADIQAESGLMVDVTNLDQSGNLYAAVYENGKLVAEDSDSQYAQVMY